MDFHSAKNSAICSIFSKVLFSKSTCASTLESLACNAFWINISVVREKFNQFDNVFYRWFCKWRSEYNNKKFKCLKTSNQIITKLLNQHVQHLHKLASMKLMKFYLCGGFLVRVGSNWCFSHPMLLLEFLFGTIVTNFPGESDACIDFLIHCIVIISYFLQRLNCALDDGHSIYND